MEGISATDLIMMLVFTTSQDSQHILKVPMTRYCSIILAFRNFLKAHLNWCNCKDVAKTQLLEEMHKNNLHKEKYQ
jgi:hypothetical protein